MKYQPKTDIKMFLLLLVCGTVVAVSADELILEEIIVTAQKREQVISDVPMSVQAFSGASMELQGVNEVGEVIQFVPGATFGQRFTPALNTYTLRGVMAFPQGDGPNGYYVDGTPFAVTSFAIAPPAQLYDLERVEVLRGPQGTLYGQSSVGGTIKLITKEPDASAGFGGKARIIANTVNDGDAGYSGDLAFNIPIIEDVLAGRISISYREDGGWVDDSTDGDKDVNEHEYFNIRGKLLYTPNEDILVRLSAWHNEVDTPDGNSVTDPKNRTLVTAGGLASLYDVGFDTYSAFASVTMGNVIIENSLSYMDYEQDNFSYAALDFGFGPFVAFSAPFLMDATSLANEFRILSNYDSPLQWIAGVYVRDGETEFDVAVNVPGFQETHAIETTESLSWAVFGELTYAFNEQWEATVGLRYFEDDREFTSAPDRLVVFGAPLPPPPTQNSSETFDTLNPRFNLTYRPSEDGMFFFNVAQGFRSGQLPTASSIALAQSAGFEAGNVKPDKLIGYELGTRWQLLNGALDLDLIAYYNDWQDVQFSPSVANVAVSMNVGDAEMRGIDFTLRYRTPVTGLVLAAAGNYNDSEWDTVQPALTAQLPGFASGERLPAVPEKSFSGSLDYRTPVYNGWDLHFYGSYSYRDKQSRLSTADLITGVITDLTLRASVEKADKWGLTLYVKNALDEDDIADYPGIPGLLGVVRPREIGLQLTTRF